MALDLVTIDLFTRVSSLSHKKHPDPDSLRARECYYTRWSRDGLIWPSFWRGGAGTVGNVRVTMVTYRIGQRLYAASFARAPFGNPPYGSQFFLAELGPIEDAAFDPKDFSTWRMKCHTYNLVNWETEENELDIPNWWGYPHRMRFGPIGGLGKYFIGMHQARLEPRSFVRYELPPNGPPGADWPPEFPEFYLQQLPNEPGT